MGSSKLEVGSDYWLISVEGTLCLKQKHSEIWWTKHAKWARRKRSREVVELEGLGVGVLPILKLMSPIRRMGYLITQGYKPHIRHSRTI